jgi:uncharacterized protein (DUF2384 family)
MPAKNGDADREGGPRRGVFAATITLPRKQSNTYLVKVQNTSYISNSTALFIKGTSMLAALLSDFREADHLSPQRMSKRLRLPIAEFARLTHLHRNTLAKSPSSAAVQKRLEPVARILSSAEDLTGDADRAIVWFRHQPLPGHDGRTAQDLVEAGHSDAVLAYLEDLRDGAYA